MAERGRKSGTKTTGTTAKRAPRTWEVAGVSKKTQDLVTRAAKEDGVAVGKWVDTALRGAAESRLKGGPGALVVPSDLLNTLSRLSEQVKDLSERRSLGGRAFNQAQETASELSDQISSAYDAVIKHADAALDDLKSWTGETLEDAAKVGTTVIEQIKSVAGGIEKLHHLVTGEKTAETPQKPEKPAKKQAKTDRPAGKA